MKKLTLLNAIALLFFCMAASAQKSSSDSLSLVSKIEADQMKLNDLESQLALKKVSQQEAIAKAQQSASATTSAAEKLSDNPKNKKMAKRAHKNASEHRRDARNAKLEANKINKLNKEIKSTKKRLSKNQARLDKYVQRGRVITSPPDTIQH